MISRVLLVSLMYLTLLLPNSAKSKPSFKVIDIDFDKKTLSNKIKIKNNSKKSINLKFMLTPKEDKSRSKMTMRGLGTNSVVTLPARSTRKIYVQFQSLGHSNSSILTDWDLKIIDEQSSDSFEQRIDMLRTLTHTTLTHGSHGHPSGLLRIKSRFKQIPVKNFLVKGYCSQPITPGHPKYTREQVLEYKGSFPASKAKIEIRDLEIKGCEASNPYGLVQKYHGMFLAEVIDLDHGIKHYAGSTANTLDNLEDRLIGIYRVPALLAIPSDI